MPVSGLIAFLLLGIEEIGVQIEEPFSILPLEAMCAGAEHDLREGLASEDAVKQIVQVQALHSFKAFVAKQTLQLCPLLVAGEWGPADASL